MDAKLTLKLNSKVIEEAKLYAKETNTSLSKLIESYLSVVTSNKLEKRKINPIVKSLTGLIKLDDKRDYRKSYAKYLSEKYK
jgi:predicted metalloendopeptidase